jgi:hypothetical protein
MIGWFVNNELERMWKEMVMASFEAMSCHFPGRTQETTLQSTPGAPTKNQTGHLPDNTIKNH